MTPTKRYASIRNAEGELVESNIRADTMALYFQNVQWKIQFANLAPERTEIIHPGISVSEVHFSFDELQRVLRKLKEGKAHGNEGIPPEFWKFVGENEYAAR